MSSVSYLFSLAYTRLTKTVSGSFDNYVCFGTGIRGLINK